MIRFEGQLSRECQKYIRKTEAIAQIVVFTIVLLLFAYPMYLMVASMIAPVVGISIFASLYITIVILSFVSPPQKEFIKKVPHKITISSVDNTMISVSVAHTLETEIDNVKSVCDMGNWYLFKFASPPNYSLNFICQKDLIVEGTIEDFEKLFEGKIIKKK